MGDIDHEHVLCMLHSSCIFRCGVCTGANTQSVSSLVGLVQEHVDLHGRLLVVGLALCSWLLREVGDRVPGALLHALHVGILLGKFLGSQRQWQVGRLQRHFCRKMCLQLHSGMLVLV